MLITLPTLADLQLVRDPLDLDAYRKGMLRRWRAMGRRWYGTALTPPLNTADCVFAYSTDNNSFTDMANVLDVKFSGRVKKVIQRMLLGGTYVAKFTARLNDGDITITQEWGNAIFAVFNTAFLAETRHYWRLTMPDTGGTAGSKFVCDGYIQECNPPDAAGDDADATFTMKMAINVITYTGGS
jgi:hypothetical protein